jgi:predicted Zn-dependent peptidase
VDRDKTVVLEEIEKLVEEPVRSVMDELDEMVNIIMV